MEQGYYGLDVVPGAVVDDTVMHVIVGGGDGKLYVRDGDGPYPVCPTRVIWSDDPEDFGISVVGGYGEGDLYFVVYFDGVPVSYDEEDDSDAINLRAEMVESGEAEEKAISTRADEVEETGEPYKLPVTVKFPDSDIEDRTFYVWLAM